MVNLERCIESYDTLDDPSSQTCVPNKTKDGSLSVFNMVTKINESQNIKKTYIMRM